MKHGRALSLYVAREIHDSRKRDTLLEHRPKQSIPEFNLRHSGITESTDLHASAHEMPSKRTSNGYNQPGSSDFEESLKSIFQEMQDKVVALHCKTQRAAVHRGSDVTPLNHRTNLREVTLHDFETTSLSCIERNYQRRRGSSFATPERSTPRHSTVSDARPPCMLPSTWPFVELRESLGTTGTGEDAEEAMAIMRALRQNSIHKGNMNIFGRVSSAMSPINQRRLVLDPNSYISTVFSYLGFLTLMYDVVLTPFYLAFEVEQSNVVFAMAWVACAYWLADLILNFVTGFYKKGELAMDLREIARHYLWTWFAVDLLLLVCDVTALTVDLLRSLEKNRNELLFLRVSKVLRLLKVLRVARLVHLLEKFTARFLSSEVRVFMQVTKIVLGTVLINHLLCCAWYAAGRHLPTDTGVTWLDDKLAKNHRGYVYITSFHWTVAQLTLGSTEITPKNSYERFFAVALLIAGLLFGSTIVSIFSAQIMEFIMVRQDQTLKLNSLRRYLQQSSPSPGLMVRIQKQVMERMSTRMPLTEERVEALELLSSGLYAELLYETRNPYVLKHPLFQLWSNVEPHMTILVCKDACKFLFFSPEDVVFDEETPSLEAYYTVRGLLKYTQEPSTARVENTTITGVGPDEAWICEAALWTHWSHVGRLEATGMCQILALDAGELANTMSKHPMLKTVTSKYAHSFHVRVCSAVPPHAPWPTDLRVPFTDISDLLPLGVGLGMLLNETKRQKTGRATLSNESLEALKAEMVSEQCAVQPGPRSGEMVRVVAVVAVKVVRRSDGCILTRVGKYSLLNGMKAKCLLPGTKRRRGELPQVALRRVLSEDLAPCADYLKVNGVDHVVETTDKGKYGMPAKYLKTVHHAIYDDEKACKPLGKTVHCCSGENVDRGHLMGHMGSMNCGRKLAPHDLPEIVVLRADSRDELDVYCWLPANHFEALFAGEHQDVLQTWLSSFPVSSDTVAATLSMDLDEDVVEAEQTCDTNVQFDSCGRSENSSSLESEASLEPLKAMRTTPRAASKGPDITVAVPDPTTDQYL